MYSVHLHPSPYMCTSSFMIFVHMYVQPLAPLYLYIFTSPYTCTFASASLIQCVHVHTHVYLPLIHDLCTCTNVHAPPPLQLYIFTSPHIQCTYMYTCVHTKCTSPLLMHPCTCYCIFAHFYCPLIHVQCKYMYAPPPPPHGT